MDWSEWSKEAVSSMHEQNAAWMKKFRLENAPFRWDLDKAALVFGTGEDAVIATVCLVGTTSERAGSFLWSWGNTTIPAQHKEALEIVIRFGKENNLALLTTPEIAGGRPEAIECMCIAGRLQKALGTFSDQIGDVGVYFTILHFQPVGGTLRTRR